MIKSILAVFCLNQLKQEDKMKRLIAAMMMALFLSGCGAAARESGFYDHNTMYKNWDHLKFSVYGYQDIRPKAVDQSRVEEWWGKAIEVYR